MSPAAFINVKDVITKARGRCRLDIAIPKRWKIKSLRT
ncbi:Uncharacterised protein [Vibrio cholerae]|nr:Uncharacterised protein [Vibrio cholerae]